MQYYAFLLYLTFFGEPTSQIVKFAQSFQTYEDCMTYARAKAGEPLVQSDSNPLDPQPACLLLKTK